jgi:phosphatidylglycerophosphate synthase
VDPAAALQPGTPGPPVVTLVDGASRRAAEAHLWSSIRKTVAHDGVVAYYLARPLSRPLTRMALRTALTPNQVTLVGLLVGIASGVVASRGGSAGYVGAALLFFLGLVLDCVDGEMARLTLGTSRLGQWLDTLTDDVSVAALTLGFGLGLQRDTGADLYQWLGLGGAACVVLGQAYIYAYLVRRGGPMDTATYPWFFASDTGFVGGERRSLVGTLAFAWRRDSMTALFVLLALAGQAPVILYLLAGGAAVYLALLVVDAAVKLTRGRAGA